MVVIALNTAKNCIDHGDSRLIEAATFTFACPCSRVLPSALRQR